MLLDGVVQVDVVHQHGHPALVEFRRLGQARMQPADGAALLMKRRGNRLQQMRLAAAAVAPQVGGHWRMHGMRVLADPHLEMAHRRFVRPREKAGQRRARVQADVECELLHASMLRHGCTGPWPADSSVDAVLRFMGTGRDRAAGPLKSWRILSARASRPAPSPHSPQSPAVCHHHDFELARPPQLQGRRCRHRRRRRADRPHQAAREENHARGRAGRYRWIRRPVRSAQALQGTGAGERHRRRRHQAQAGLRMEHARHGRHRPGRDERERRAGARRRAAVLPRLLRLRQARHRHRRAGDRRHRPRLRIERLRPHRRRDRRNARHVPGRRIRPGGLRGRRGREVEDPHRPGREARRRGAGAGSSAGDAFERWLQAWCAR